jgi:hypothetical protein
VALLKLVHLDVCRVVDLASVPDATDADAGGYLLDLLGVKSELLDEVVGAGNWSIRIEDAG